MPPASPLLALFLAAAIITCAAATTSSSSFQADALLAFMAALTVPPEAAPTFATWDATAASAPCGFTGVTCASGNVTALSLPAHKLSAATVPFADLCASLPSLATLSLPENSLAGGIDGVVACTALRDLNLAFNSFTGSVPDLSPLSGLRRLNVSSNCFDGAFPWRSLAATPGLTLLALGDNPFLAPTAPFPAEVTRLTNLTVLYMSAVKLGGAIPQEIGDLVNLEDLELSDNDLTGEIPSEIARLTRLTHLELYNNSLRGPLPDGFGNLTKLQYFDASQNNLTGTLAELRSLTRLVSLQLFFNGFTGEVPPEFGDFKELVNLSLYNNNLTGELPRSLGSWAPFNFIDVSTNALSGPIPPDMCKQGTMLKLLMLENNFSGGIPETYASCKTLVRFRVSKNSLSGEVPEGLWALPNVNVIDLAGNQFTGSIGDGIGNATAMTILYLGGNRFTGAIPPSIGDAASLETMDLSWNQLSGEIPDSIGRLSRLGSLDIEGNAIGGPIPASLGSCSALSTVNFAGNRLSGAIPAELGNLQRLNSLDVSRNDLSGAVPASLAALKLSSLNMSDNYLTGPVPDALAISAYGESFVGNPGLCATNGAVFLHRCGPSSGSRSANAALQAITCILAVTAVLLAVLGVAIYLQKRRRAAEAAEGLGPAGKLFAKNGSWDLKSFRILAFDEREIIDGVRDENLIGSGGSGNVYRVKLGNGAVVAVKHITRRAAMAAGSTAPSAAMLGGAARRTASVRCREFDSEVGTLSAIRHVNVVKLLCSITSSDGAASLLVYEHLPNGSLYERLHGTGAASAGRKLGGGLGWAERHDVAGEGGETESRDLVDWVSRRLESREKVMSLVDPAIVEGWAREEAVRVLRVAVLCTSRTPSMRPSMRSVVQMLEDAAAAREDDDAKVLEVKVV
ncbi:unnamed protein product [Miscanthus lutarioriparius]|uniref:non-specific serine/threonine protein kinase n=1 Tax=Miscanthus lutarioriparius TaxID=422564 RepID=A0A811RHX6_9POAL|nr:unnamed protein product [Miscanthus lutarioriparius]